MSAATRTLDRRGERSFSGVRSHAGSGRAVTERPWLRLLSFGVFAAYGVERWATLMRPVPGWRLLGLLVLALALAGGVPWIARRDRVIAGLAGAALIVLGLPMAGLRWQWFVHERVARSERLISHGLGALPGVLVPYLGSDRGVRLVIVLGAAVLLLDAAAVLAFAGRTGSAFGDGRRMAAALPLTALAVVPSTIVRPQFPYLQGLLLFALLAAFMWGERIPRPAAGSAVAVLGVVGVVGAIAAPRIDPRSPWIDYRSWSAPVARHVDRFDWSQTYGPLRWPDKGRTVLTIDAHTPDYWKTEDLDRFDGTGWTTAIVPAAPLPKVTAAEAKRWTQKLTVDVDAMTTSQVIAAGDASAPTGIPGGVTAGTAAGTWVANRPLTPGTIYSVRVYSPQPTPAQLQAVRRYPAGLATYRQITLPGSTAGSAVKAIPPQITFPAFHARAKPTIISGQLTVGSATATLRASPYGPVYALAQKLASTAATPYAFIESVKRYLSHGFRYDQNPPLTRYPLVSFLTTDRVGYCQQFAGAMALLLRMGGIPARVATGFTSGSQSALTSQFEVSDIDAHAWVEAYFPQSGWVRFDPTPAVAPALATSTDQPITRGLEAKLNGERGHRHELLSSAVAGTTRQHSSSGSGISAWLVVALVALLGLGGLIARAVVRYRRLSHDPLSELERAMTRTGRPLAGGVTLSELEHQLRTTPEAAEYIRRLRAERYGGAVAPPTRLQRRALRHELARGLGLRGVARAWWALPPQPLGPRRATP